MYDVTVTLNWGNIQLAETGF